MAEAVHILVEGGGHAVGLEHAEEGVGAPAEQQADQFVVPWKTRWTEDASTARHCPSAGPAWAVSVAETLTMG